MNGATLWKCDEYVMVVAGDRVAMFGNCSKDVTIWDYTTGVEVLVLTCPADVRYYLLHCHQTSVSLQRVAANVCVSGTSKQVNVYLKTTQKSLVC